MMYIMIIVTVLVVHMLLPLAYGGRNERSLSSINSRILKEIRVRVNQMESRLNTKCSGKPLPIPDARGSGGAMYVRWGRTTCLGRHTELVYKGQAGGSYYRHSGAAANHLCLPSNPTWARYNDKTSNHAYVYGAEISSNQQNIPGSTVDHKYHGQDIPCAVCRSKRISSSLMIPGRNICDKGSTLEYKGYLMAGRHNHPTATEYVCMDEHAERMHGGRRHYWHTIFYSVEARYGSLRCPPYVNGREITCTVCTR